MKHSETEKLFSAPSDIVVGSAEDERTCIHRFRDSGVFFRNFTLNSKKGGEPVEILQITDIHFNYCDENDLKDEELADTFEHRKWNANAASAESVKRTIPLSKYFDKTIVTGDTLDYLSEGAMELTKKYIWDVDPDILIALGGHELTREMQTGKPDKTPLSERLAYLQANWRHDIHYHSEIIGGKVLAVVLDNSQSKFLPGQAEKLRADIQRARDEKLVLLIFEHEPLSTGCSDDARIKAIKRYDPEFVDLWSGASIGSVGRADDEATREVYDLITHNADVIGGIFCGHEHSAFYSEIRALTPGGERRVIPQILLEGSPYDDQAGHILRITIY